MPTKEIVLRPISGSILIKITGSTIGRVCDAGMPTRSANDRNVKSKLRINIGPDAPEKEAQEQAKGCGSSTMGRV